MSALRAILVDDEAPARRRLRRMLEKAGVEIAGEAGDGVSALDEIARLAPDAVFLDIEMPELDGFGVAQALGGKGPAIVFVTAYDQFALKAFDACAVDYLVKPVTEARLEAALAKLRSARAPAPPPVADLISRLGATVTRFAVRIGSKYCVFDPARISSIQSLDHYSSIRVDGRELLSDDPLDELERRLPPGAFLRVHRGALIHLAFLKELEREGDRKYVAILTDGTRVAVSRERLPELKARLGI
jgi:two-component system LytT family response regulator